MKTTLRKVFLAIALLALILAGVIFGTDRAVKLRSWITTVSITKQPVSHAVMEGHSTTFDAGIRGMKPLRYQWLKNGVEIPGATALELTTSPAEIADDGSKFQVVVRNWRQSVLSSPAILRVLVPQPQKVVAFPLRVSASGRYLVDQDGKPFRIQGDSAWSLIANLTNAEAEEFLNNRRDKGFNTVLVNLIEHKYAQGGKGANFTGVPSNRSGGLPFKNNEDGGPYDGTWGSADFSTPNESYFAFADSIVDLAAKKNILVNLAPMFLGFNGNEAGWWADLTNRANTRDVVYKFGLFVGNRYKDRKNVIWMIGGDHFPPPDSEGEARLLKFMQGIKASGASQLWSGDWKASSLSVDEPLFAPYMDLNAVYTYGLLGHPGATYDEAKKGFGFTPTRPAYLKETGYENERIFPGDPASVRMYQYFAILGGATAGAFFGNRDIWKMSSDRWWFETEEAGHGPWTSAMESRGSLDFVLLGRLLDSLPWYDLVPSGLSGMKNLIPVGAGNYGTTEYVVSAGTPDGKALVAYIPPRRMKPASIAVDMTAMSGPSVGTWFDPVSGTSTQIAGSPFPNVATRNFVSPGTNSAGDMDWVLVLRAKE